MDDRAAPAKENRRSGPRLASLADRRSASARSLLFLFSLTKTRLPSGSLLAWCCRNYLDLFLLGLLGLPIAFLLTFGHVDLLGVADDAGTEFA